MASSSWQGGMHGCLLQLGTGGLPGRSPSLMWAPSPLCPGARLQSAGFWRPVEQHWGCARGSSLRHEHTDLLVTSASARQTPHTASTPFMGTSCYQPHSSSTSFPLPSLPLLPDHASKHVTQSQHQGRYIGVNLEVSYSFCLSGTFPTRIRKHLS